MAPGRVADSYGGYRSRLVETLRSEGISDLAVLRAFAETPRHVFVPEALRNRAYDDTSLPIGHGQTISQPSTQARYLQALELTGHERVLEVGTGSGYQAALLAHMVEWVVTIERIRELAQSAREALERAGTRGVIVVTGDGSLGWRPEAPYDAILVAAASPSVPEPLLRQLTPRGRLVIPIEREDGQELVRITNEGTNPSEESLGSVRFVPLIGQYGHPPDGEG